MNMVFTKSFGYALRGILYIATKGSDNKIHLAEIADHLALPKHFLGKIMRSMVSKGILSSEKGPGGGFYMNEKTLQTSLKTLVELTGEMDTPDACVLRLRKCSAASPCPLHHQVKSMRDDWQNLMTNTSLGDLLYKDQSTLIRSIAI
jgi:Rrf2 family transcriptional regulator, iron-sulfur cluster assembly transcription factor